MNKLTQGTPKTLTEAIENGLLEANRDISRTREQISIIIEPYIRDFLAQHFTSAMMGRITLTELWERIIEKVGK